ncbi:NAD(P)H-dependent oxidoreductase [Microbacterium sp. NIBRBAC000506063]|uniref:NAD(P)H-dependent oxidoreductase n=1 Tax=Microbacterium sp. NIBRBAC000506063 TaxID=2734618 RepID=UPI001CB6E1FF|nr:NAD(P)H-dependent oxidoreductase [Microbacterium sp. NIBRBAC000506063]
MDVVVVAGNPKPASRTLSAGVRLAELVAPDAEIGTVDVIELGAGLLGWGDATVAEAVSLAKRAKLLVVASPTFKGTYTGVLKLFLDQFETATGLAGVTAVPLMLGAGPAHALAPELLLKPVLVEVGPWSRTGPLRERQEIRRPRGLRRVARSLGRDRPPIHRVTRAPSLRCGSA